MSEDPNQYGEPRQEPTPSELADELAWIARGLGETEAKTLRSASLCILKMETELSDLRLQFKNHSRSQTVSKPKNTK